MPRPLLEDYERTVEPAVRVLNTLSDKVLEDFTVGQGIAWWVGYTDWKRLILIANYLLDAVAGTGESLAMAGLASRTHREMLFADNHWLDRRWAQAAKQARVTDHGFLAAVTRGPAERRRERSITMSAQQCLFHLCQALDRAAATIIAVGALRRPLLTADWGYLTAPANAARDHQESRYLEPIGTGARLHQDALLLLVKDWPQYGPIDWLPWLLRARNTDAHRAPKMAYLMLRLVKGRGKGVIRPFYRQPGWDDTESMVAGTTERRGPAGLVLLQESPDVLDGLLKSMTEFLAAIASGMIKLWLARRAEPKLLVQPGEQWREVLAQPILGFPGYGPDVEVSTGKVFVAPETGLRLQGSRLTDARRKDWQDHD